MKRLAFLLLTALAVGMTSGCSSNSEPPANHQASVGQQLTDLDRARREGIITEKEYEKLRKAIIRKND
jgi:uncharacterized lipoprotein